MGYMIACVSFLILMQDTHTCAYTQELTHTCAYTHMHTDNGLQHWVTFQVVLSPGLTWEMVFEIEYNKPFFLLNDSFDFNLT